MQEGRKEGRRGENEIGENKRWFYGGYLGGSGLRTRGHSVGNAGKIEPYTLFFKNVVSLPGV